MSCDTILLEIEICGYIHYDVLSDAGKSAPLTTKKYVSDLIYK
jgi:hypothetical protein